MSHSDKKRVALFRFDMLYDENIKVDILYCYGIIVCLFGMHGFNRSLQDANIAADRLFEIFDLEIDDE